MNNTIDLTEAEKFASLALEWWDKDAALKTLHDINPVRLDFIQKYATLAHSKILDVGCGGGILAESMADTGGIVTGLDIAAELIKIASEHATQHAKNIQYVCQPIENHTSTDYDIITCMEMLEHVPDPEVVLQHCARLLRPNGLLFLSTINRNLTSYALAILLAEYVFEWLPRQTHEYKKFIKPSELAAMARNSGFEILALSGMGYNPITRVANLQTSVKINYLIACRKI